MRRTVITAAFLMMIPALSNAQGKVEVPEKALQEMGFLVGEWEAKGTFNGEESSGVYTAEWAPGKHCLLLTSNWNAPASGIGGWSADKKQYVEFWYAADGTQRTFWYSLGKKGVWEGKWTEVSKDGKKGAGEISLEKKENEYVVTATGKSAGGEKLEVKITNKKK